MPRELNELPELEMVEYLVLTAEEARSVWDTNPYNNKPDLRPSQADVRRHLIPDTARDAWWKLPR